MSPLTLGIFGFAGVLISLAMGIPVGISMVLVGFLGVTVLGTPTVAFGMLSVIPVSVVTSVSLIPIPLFILMGELMVNTGVVGQAFNAATLWFGRVKGGLAAASVVASALFAFVSGSSVASVALLGKVTVPEMIGRKYSPGLSYGSTAVGGTLAILIPPSTAMIILAWLTEESLARLMIAGIIPGILSAVMYIGVCFIWASRPGAAPVGVPTSWKDKFTGSKTIWPVILLAVLIMGSIYTGISSPSEAASIGVVGAVLIVGMLSKPISRMGGTIWASVLETGQTASMIFIIVIGASFFTKFLLLTGLPAQVSQALIALEMNRWIYFGLVLVMYLILGMFIDPLGMLLITVPLTFPAAVALGFDPIWQLIIVIKMAEIGLITPPFGLNIFVLKSVVPEADFTAMIRGSMIFLSADVLWITALCIFPQIVLFLPNLMK